MRIPHPAALLLALASCGSPGLEGAPPPAGRPTLLVLVTDDRPFDALGCAGHPILRTPHTWRSCGRR